MRKIQLLPLLILVFSCSGIQTKNNQEIPTCKEAFETYYDAGCFLQKKDGSARSPEYAINMCEFLNGTATRMKRTGECLDVVEDLLICLNSIKEKECNKCLQTVSNLMTYEL